MRDFTRSLLTWTTPPKDKHRYYKYDGGFVGTLGDFYRVRLKVDSTCRIDGGAEPFEMFLMYPCRGEYTIARGSFFVIPSSEWRTV